MTNPSRSEHTPLYARSLALSEAVTRLQNADTLAGRLLLRLVLALPEDGCDCKDALRRAGSGARSSGVLPTALEDTLSKGPSKSCTPEQIRSGLEHPLKFQDCRATTEFADARSCHEVRSPFVVGWAFVQITLVDPQRG